MAQAAGHGAVYDYAQHPPANRLRHRALGGAVRHRGRSAANEWRPEAARESVIRLVLGKLAVAHPSATGSLTRSEIVLRIDRPPTSQEREVEMATSRPPRIAHVADHLPPAYVGSSSNDGASHVVENRCQVAAVHEA